MSAEDEIRRNRHDSAGTSDHIALTNDRKSGHKGHVGGSKSMYQSETTSNNAFGSNMYNSQAPQIMNAGGPYYNHAISSQDGLSQSSYPQGPQGGSMAYQMRPDYPMHS
jgi:hypothetical protein